MQDSSPEQRDTPTLSFALEKAPITEADAHAYALRLSQLGIVVPETVVETPVSPPDLSNVTSIDAFRRRSV
jgi:hypothetical protein